MDKRCKIPTGENDADRECDSDSDGIDLEEMVEANNERLDRIIGKVEHLTKRKNEAWKVGRRLKAEFAAKCEEYEKKMSEVGRTLQGEPRYPTAMARESPQALEFSDCSSEKSADIALCEKGDVSRCDTTNSFESGGSAWLTSEVMGLSPEKRELEISAQEPSLEVNEKSLDLNFESTESTSAEVSG